jgi:hypothetical protein
MISLGRAASLAALTLCGCASYTASELPPPERHRQRTYFGEDFGSVGAIPVLVVVENRGDRPRHLQPGARIKMPDGSTENEYGVAVWSLFNSEPGHAQSAATFVLFGGIGWLAAAAAQREAKSARAIDFGRKSFVRSRRSARASLGVSFLVARK